MSRLRGKISKSWLERRLYFAFLEARKGKTKTADEYVFDVNWRRNIDLLTDDILDKTYHPSRGVAFIVRKPVIREIFAAPFRDRVIHHFIHQEVADWWDRRLIYSSSSCRKNKGTLFGIKRLEHDIRSVSKDYTKETYIIKLDIKGYFMSLSRKMLYQKAVWGLKQQFPERGHKYELLKFLWKEVIFDDPVKGVKKRPPISAWKKLPGSKSLFRQPPGYGIVIGNLSSQLLSNVFLDQLDRFVMMELGYKHYGRYVDDFYIVVGKEEFPQAKKDTKAIAEYLQRMGLTLHPHKCYVQEVRHGVAFLGMVLYPNRRVPARRVKDSFYQAARQFTWGVRKYDALVSYLGYCKHANAKNLCEKVFRSVGWEYKR